MSTLKEDDVAEAAEPVADTGLSARANKKPKVAVEEEILLLLKAGYQKHYTEYSRWKKNVNQKLPGKVWKGVYKDLISKLKASHEEKGMPFSINEIPSERTLQDSLRAVIVKEGTGNSDIDGAEKIEQQGDDILKQLNEVQEDDVLRRLQEDDNRARRDMNNLRNDLIEGGYLVGGFGVGVSSTTSPLSQNKATEEAASEPDTPAQIQAVRVQTNPIEEASEPEKPGQIQSLVAASLEKMAKTISENGRDMLQFLKVQVEVSSKKLEIASREHKADMVMKELQKLAFLRDNAIISAEEFILRAKQVTGIPSAPS